MKTLLSLPLLLVASILGFMVTVIGSIVAAMMAIWLWITKGDAAFTFKKEKDD